MRYPVVLHGKKGRADYGVTAADLPGRVSAGDTLAEAIGNTEEAIPGHLDVMAADGTPVPAPGVTIPADLSPGCLLAVVDFDPGKLALSGKTVRLNVSIPERTAAPIDRAAKRAGTSPSNFLARATAACIDRGSRMA